MTNNEETTNPRINPKISRISGKSEQDKPIKKGIKGTGMEQDQESSQTQLDLSPCQGT